MVLRGCWGSSLRESDWLVGGLGADSMRAGVVLHWLGRSRVKSVLAVSFAAGVLTIGLASWFAGPATMP